MSKFIITGGKEINGVIRASGNKNAVLPMMAASLLTDGVAEITNVPKILDVLTMGRILSEMGCTIEGLGTDKLKIDTGNVKYVSLERDLVAKLRASILLLGPLISRFGKAELRHPGGCIIGRRPIGTHFAALEKLGINFKSEGEQYRGVVKKLKPASIFLDEASVTATENVIMAAVKIPGTTVINHAACEPHIVTLADFLNSAGAKITGAGTNRIVIEGVSVLHSTSFPVRADHIEVGSFAAAAAVSGGDLVITDVMPEDLQIILIYLKKFGVNANLEKTKEGKGSGWALHVKPSELRAVEKIDTGLWPAFPTDLMSVFIVLATQAKGVTLCHDWMYEGRMFFVERLASMGADITVCDPHRVLVFGPSKLRGKKLDSPDLRAGMALVLAALCAEGESEIDKIELIERGYEDLDKRLGKLGARIKKV